MARVGRKENAAKRVICAMSEGACNASAGWRQRGCVRKWLGSNGLGHALGEGRREGSAGMGFALIPWMDVGGLEPAAMLVRDFLAKIETHPRLELVYSDPTMCIIRCQSSEGERKIRLGLWAVRRMHWEQLVEAFRIPVEAAS